MAEARKETGLGLGERLRSTRKARAMTLEQAGQALHLEEYVLRALEEERFETLGAPVFVRGHLRNYARLLGLAEDAVLDAYRIADPASEAVPRMTRDREKPLGTGPGPLGIAAIILVVLLGLVLFYFLGDGVAPPASRAVPSTSALPPEPAAPLPEAPAPEPAGEAPPGDVGVMPAEPVLSQPVTTEPATGILPPAPATAPAPLPDDGTAG